MVGTTHNIPWDEIHKRYEAGENSNALANEYTAKGIQVRRQTIDSRARKEGWGENGKWLRAAHTTETSKRLANPQTKEDKGLVTRGNKTPEIQAEILCLLNKGAPYNIAAGAVGLNEEILREWRKSDPSFNDLCLSARQLCIAKHYGNIDKAGDRDWRASQAYLQSAPETRKDWRGAEEQGKGGIHVTINLRGTTDAPEALDITPKTVTIGDSKTLVSKSPSDE